MPILSQPAFGPKVALIYVTSGMLIDVWTLVWYFTREYQLSHTQQFWVIGLVLTGLTFIFLGLVLGPLGRQARRAELPPADAVPAEAAIQQTAAAHSPLAVTPAMPVAPIAPAAAPVAPPGTVLVSPAARVS